MSMLIYDPSKGLVKFIKYKFLKNHYEFFNSFGLISVTKFNSFHFQFNNDFQYAVITVVDLEDFLVLEWVVKSEIKNIFLIINLKKYKEIYSSYDNFKVVDINLKKNDLFKELESFFNVHTCSKINSYYEVC